MNMGGDLNKYARKQKKENVTVVTARLNDSKHEEFKAYCDGLGLSINEAINLLIDIELTKERNKNKKVIDKPIDDEKENDSKINHDTIQDEIIISDENELSDEKQNDSAEMTKSDSAGNKKRFTVVEYVIDNQIPCPICNKWINRSNFSKHAKTHGYKDTENLYNEHIEKVKEMYKDRAELQPKEQ